MNDSEHDWATDFGAAPKTDGELERWHESLQGDGNAELRLLVAEAMCMRWSARILLERLRAAGRWPLRDGQDDGALKFAGWLVEQRK